ncbi:MAG: NirD/YgiW/YdeI family stress tolerance protein [Spirochaetaceae bacterium]|jgi:uncharacterized protein (TIGR00156 family)|nr:NirD/YgiW/YdeI family stress tolerance protein [Spirochaetaceae bacterium]
MRKRFSFFVLLTAFVLTGVAGAQEGLRGGYTGPSINISSIQEAKKMWDESPVSLEGRIERFVGDEKYMFMDGTDTIIIEIDNDVWRGLSVGASDVVVIYGEVDKNFGQIEIEVDRVVKKQS